MAAKQFTLHSTRWYASAFALRQRMLNFVQNFEYYMMFEVIEPHWRHFQASLGAVENIDQVLALHMELLESCMKDCMLINQELLKIVTKLMMVCITFSNFIQVNIREKQKDWKLPAKNEKKLKCMYMYM